MVAKTHPLEVRRPNLPLKFADNAHINDLIEMSDAVLLLNSGTGLLSLCWAKPVLIAGTAYYSHPLLNRTVKSVPDVLDALKCLPAVDQDTRDRFFHYLISKVYSFGEFQTELVRQEDGAFRNITRHIEFRELRIPEFKKKKALLYVTSVIPWPINRGSAHRTDQVLRALLEQDCAVDLICLNQSEADASNLSIEARLRERYPNLRRVTVCRHPMLPVQTPWPDLVAKAKYNVVRWLEVMNGRAGTINAAWHCPPVLERAIEQHTASAIYDAIWFNYLRVLPRRHTAEAKIICDLHDYQTERIRADVLPTLPRRRRASYLARFARSEAAALARCDVAIAISPVERDLLVRDLKPQGEMVVIPAADDHHDRQPLPIAYDLLYVGSRSDANIVGLRWFMEQCFARIVSELPNVRLLIQGSIADMPALHDVLDRLPSGENIALSAAVESLEDVYSSVRLVVCPVLHGTGMKIKMVEAMSYGHAVVATSKAAEGIARDLGLETYDTPVDFSAACVQNLSHPDTLSKSQAASRATFARDHNHNQLIEQIAAAIARI